MFKKIFYHFWAPKSKFNFINKIKDQSNILDVGCGENSVSKVNKIKKNINYFGIDILDQECFVDKSNKIRLIKCLSENFHKEILKFKNIDYVIWSHNIEHCERPFEVLQNISSVHNKNGLMFISTPSERSEFFRRGVDV